MMIHKGDKIIVRATVYTRYGHNVGELLHKPPCTGNDADTKSLYRRREEKPWLGLVVGCSWKATGTYNDAEYSGGDEYNRPSLTEDERHKVWMVVPLGTDRYLRPFACLEEDLDAQAGDGSGKGATADTTAVAE